MSNTAEVVAGVAVEIIFVALAAGLLVRIWGRFFAVPQRQKVLAYQRGVVLRGEVVDKVIGPGVHWIRPKQTLVLCDMRARPFQVASQELIAADGMAVRVSLGGEQKIVDPAAFVRESSDGYGTFYLELRQAIRVAVGEHAGDSVIGGSSSLPVRIRELLIPKAAHLGLEIASLDVSEAVPLGWVRQHDNR
jgi:regulator of protease activity HflC (stomatin/prohibitin superfamily)